MSEKEFRYVDSNPTLQITFEGSSKLGYRYNIYKYKISSKIELTDNQIRVLRSIGLLGYGQEFYLREKTVKEYDVPCVVVLDGINHPDIEATNPWTGKPYPSQKHKLYEYIVEDRVDSTG